MVEIGKDHDFAGAGGKVSLAELFEGRRQLDRGTDILNGTLNYLDLTPLGRQEDWEEPRGRSNTSASGWWELQDEY